MQELMDLFLKKSKEKHSNIIYAQAYKNGILKAEYKLFPVKTRLNVWSVSKPFVAMAAGIAEKEGIIKRAESIYADFQQYFGQLKRSGIRVLNNQSCKITICGTLVRISGLELPLSSYKKGKKPHLEKDFIKRHLGAAPDADGRLQILLAHHPAFAEQYADWGADLTVCGHNHGGLICIPGLGSVVSPQFMLFPKYDAGEFCVHGRKIYISRGLGTHTFHIRIFNRAELVVITVNPQQKTADPKV